MGRAPFLLAPLAADLFPHLFTMTGDFLHRFNTESNLVGPKLHDRQHDRAPGWDHDVSVGIAEVNQLVLAPGKD